MSHFSVLIQVPKENNQRVMEYLEKVLAPYDENKEVEAYIDMPAEEVKKEYERIKLKFPKEYKEMPIDEWAIDWFGRELDENGNLITRYNPKSKWDWWVLGGRWSNMLTAKNGDKGDICRVGDLDFKAMIEERRKEREKIWEESKKDEHMDDGLRKHLYGIEPNSTKKEYVDGVKPIRTYAVITKDGEWVSRGEMGLFGMTRKENISEEEWNKSFKETFIDSLDEDDYIAIVDCHI